MPIRFATVDDLPDVRRLWKQFTLDHGSRYPENLLADIDEVTRQVAMALVQPTPSFFIVLAFPEGSPVPVGFFVYEIQTRAFGTPKIYGFAHYVYLEKQHRSKHGSGLAADMVQVVGEHMLSLGIDACEAATKVGNRQWEYLGWEPYEVRWKSTATTVLVNLAKAREAIKQLNMDNTSITDNTSNGKDPDFPDVGEELSLPREGQ